MEVRAVARYMRTSPLKVHKIIGAVKGKRVEDGLNILKFLPQKAAKLLRKAVSSAVTNAEQHSMDVDKVIIQNITADRGPMLKRFRAQSRGRGVRILKRTSHVTVILSEKEE